MKKENLFRLTDPHPSYRLSCTVTSLPHNPRPPLSPLPLSPQPDSTKQTVLKFRYLHKLDSEAIDRKYELLQRLKRITRMDPDAPNDQKDEGNAPREKQYSIESYYIFNQNDPLDRRYRLHQPRPRRNKSHDHIYQPPTEGLLQHQLKDHREFLQRFKPRPSGTILAKRFRFNRKSHAKLRPFE